MERHAKAWLAAREDLRGQWVAQRRPQHPPGRRGQLYIEDCRAAGDPIPTEAGREFVEIEAAA
ncbi:MAG TPA: hypothetical protein VHX61_09495 [Rhizomicrobium sp.]|nr:hypothetical protein [Rhizomicrobium sp.]